LSSSIGRDSRQAVSAVAKPPNSALQADGASAAPLNASLYAYAVELTWLERRQGVGNRRHQQLEDAMTLVKGTAVTAERNDWR